jgi:hypothetical protein
VTGDAPDGTMLTLLGLELGDRLEPTDGELHLRIRDPRTGRDLRQLVPGAVLDELELRKWVVITGSGPVVTSEGRKAADRWIKARRRAGRV